MFENLNSRDSAPTSTDKLEKTRRDDIRHESEKAIMEIKDNVTKRFKTTGFVFEINEATKVTAKRFYTAYLLKNDIKIAAALLVSSILGIWPPFALLVFMVGITAVSTNNPRAYLYFYTGLKHDEKRVRDAIERLIFGYSNWKLPRDVWVFSFMVYICLLLLGVQKNIIPDHIVVENLDLISKIYQTTGININIYDSFGILCCAMPASTYLAYTLYESIFGFKTVLPTKYFDAIQITDTKKDDKIEPKEASGL